MKKMGLLGTLFIIISSLSGCANMMTSLGYTRIPTTTANACNRASMLITNLNADPHDRRYVLPDGRACFEVNTHE